jgi:RNA polymerase sigma-70 factor (ECF subfamily)
LKPFARLTAQYCLRKQVKSLRPELYRLAWSWCHDAQQADDLVQDTLLRGLERIDQLREQAHLKFWLCRIMSNLHKDQLRRRRECVNCDDLVLAAEDDPEREVGRQELIGQVRSAMVRLTEDQRKVLTLVDLMEFSYAEVAQLLEIPVGTVMSRLSRARERLKCHVVGHGTKVAPGLMRRVK